MDTKVLEHYLNPHGMQCAIQSVKAPAIKDVDCPAEYVRPEENWYQVQFYGWLCGGTQYKSCKLLIALPKFNPDGSFMLRDGERVVVHRCYPDMQAPPGQRRWIFRTPAQVVIDQLQKAMSDVLRDFYFTGTPPHNETARHKIRKIFADSVYFPILPQNKMARQSLHELVYLDVPSSLDLEDLRFPEELLGILDPTSTSQGSKINRAYRMCEGVKIDKLTGQAIPSNKPLCGTNMANALAVDMNLRTHLLRTSFEGSLEMENPDEPWVSGELHNLDGQHWNVALMNFRSYTWEDCIVVSESCAKQSAAIRYHTETIETYGKLELKVKQGNEVERGALLAIGTDVDGQRVEFYSKRLLTEGWVDRITVTSSMKQDKPVLRWRFWLARRAPLQTGDKVTTRFGTKGVVRVVPDHQMPHTVQGKTVDACISPESIIARKAMGLLWEMMANKKCSMLGRRFIMPHGQQLFLKYNHDAPSFETLVQEGYGAKEQLFLKKMPLPECTFVAPVYMIRLDKLAQEQATVQTGAQATNHHGVPINSGRLGGQKRDLAKLIAMESHGLVDIVDASLRENMAGVKYFSSVASVLEPEKFAHE